MAALLSLLLGVSAVEYTHEQLQSEIQNLPGVPAEANFKMFSGYITVSEQNEKLRKIFYWFVESQGAPTTDPVILWSNGGPGCSGLGGFMTEQGPFRPTVNGTELKMNPYSWNKLANVVFVEQPAGVGFSTNADSSFKYGDAQASADNYRFVVGFFKLFPQFAQNSFYTTSESYGGHYMPTLAQQLVSKDGVPNYKGFMVGNPLTYMPYRNYGQYGTYAGHNLLPAPLWKQFTDNKCQEIDAPDVCDKILQSCDKVTGGMDPYALDFPVCVGSPGPGGNLKIGRNERFAFTTKIHQAREAARKSLGLSTSYSALKSSGYFPTKYSPCDKDWGNTYLNRADVQTAIHVEGSVKWSDCSNTVGQAYSNDDVNAPMMPVYKYLLNQTKQPIDIMIYSGDDDAICATTGTQQFIWDLGYDVKTAWAPWTLEDQVAGFTALFDTSKTPGNTFRFSTVHGAGHMVPATRPEQSLELLRKYIKGDF